jgi:CBS domain-containing protein
MKVSQFCKRYVVAISAGADIVEASRLMREEHVGFLVVYATGDELRRPIGVVTDRDLVLQVMARGVDPTSVTVGDVMTGRPLIASESDDLTDVLQAMRLAGIRRVPVVDARGSLQGIIALDDVLDLITGLMCEMSGSIKTEQRQEWRARPAS